MASLTEVLRPEDPTRTAYAYPKRRPFEDDPGASGKQLKLVMKSVKDMIALLDTNGRRIYCSDSYRTLFGDLAQLPGTDSFREIHPEDTMMIFFAYIWTSVTATGCWRGEMWNRQKSNEVYPELVSVSAVKDESGTAHDKLPALCYRTQGVLAGLSTTGKSSHSTNHSRGSIDPLATPRTRPRFAREVHSTCGKNWLDRSHW